MRVVGAAILDKGELLAARRMSPADLAGKYELPGGKVEEGEDPRAALAREIFEELNVGIVVDQSPIGTWSIRKGFKRIELTIFKAELQGMRPLRSSDHDALVWLPRKSWVNGVEWLDVDKEAIIKLTEVIPE